MAKEIMEGVNPTRMELLQIRRRKALAVKGHELLSQKRDALVNSFFEIIKERKKKRREMEDALRAAFEKLIEAEMILGEEKVRSIAERISKEREMNSKRKNIMGVSIEEFELMEGEKPKYGFLTTNSSFDEAIKRAGEAMEKIIEVASIESSIQRLGKEIEKTKRRVNALEHIFIPRIIATISYIERQLEEREREDFFRRKRIKALMKKHET
ncbi:MAG: V-type ATP synthase subunit D [Thermoplasmata archaeon]|nr:MAG: V-type ATP synthase subunit D [Thermoplasmata archaeon]MCD6573631.1 V-type ATP synthase subunit D [Thermoplasmata archaeon]